MSTNYYAKFTDKKFVTRYFPEEFEEVKEGIYSTYLVHIGKRSNGWKPLFQTHPNAYLSVEEMLGFLGDCAEDILDEYGESYTVDELKQELVDFNKGLKPVKRFYSDFIGWVTLPIDHTAYFKKTTDPYERRYATDFFNDKDGYNFLIGEFS